MDVTHATPRIRERIRAFVRHPVATFYAALEELPYDYPPALILLSDAAAGVVGIVASAQRAGYWPTPLPVLAMVLLFFSLPLFCLSGLLPHPISLGAAGLAAAAAFLLQPVPADFAPFVLVVAVGQVSAITSRRVSIAFGLVAVAELIGFVLAGPYEGLPMYCGGVVLGWLVGVMLQHQRRYLYQEREYQEIRAVRAADAERGRIAREVHDVIAHSLSVTLLHLTAARHSLQTDRDVDEAVAALTDAERLGRQAMADIRRTIGLLDARPAGSAPEPGLADFTDLVGDFVRAGLRVDYAATGEVAVVSPAVGLALYRIGQESLANVVKHAPDSTVRVRLGVDAALAELTVDNTLPARPTRTGRGMGLSGMRRRAELLGGRIVAGPRGTGWSVRVRFPLVPARLGVR
ncbi:histidine kinase [Nocardia panacis]|uniref:histidine kinase n=1 Tax=Nocardia panacis TaxID=2340916 RepID=A0A3A4KAF4_9NOCA|nr:histidine kinase [Nocardia panacis]RJO75005.1 histidine kinase [Nocardia panacis]